MKNIEKVRQNIEKYLHNIDGFIELETSEMMNIPGFDVDAFRQYMRDGSGKYKEEEIQSLIEEAQQKAIIKIFRGNLVD
tara:strand:+ start:129 stop:365 length:237 start_codon:yes stop_codon:yes gene_type:complete